jgi:hypothetical protein
MENKQFHERSVECKGITGEKDTAKKNRIILNKALEVQPY